MASRLELALLEDDRVDGKTRRTLFDHLHHDNTATTLRLCSRILHDLVDQSKGRVFRDCYFSVPTGRLGISYKIPALQRIAPFCTRLTIKVVFSDQNSPYTMGEAVIEDSKRKQLIEQRRRDFERSRPPAGIARAIWNARNQFREDRWAPSIAAVSAERVMQSPEAHQSDQSLIEQVLRPLLRVTVLDIQINGDPGWPGVSHVEDSMISLRQALECSRMPALRTMRFRPVHAAGIIHFRWSAFGAFRDQPFVSPQRPLFPTAPRSGSQLWAKLAKLELQIRNPAATGTVGPKQMMMFFQVLEDYLRSFCRTLRGLHFIWLDAPGPSPLILCDLLERERMIWPHLIEFWYGNVTSVDSSLNLLSICMPQVKDVRALTSSAADGATRCTDEDWHPVNVTRSAEHRKSHSLCLHQSLAQLSQLSLVPAPLAQSRVAAALQPKPQSPSSSVVYFGDTCPVEQPTASCHSETTDGSSDTTTVKAGAVSSGAQQRQFFAPRSNSVALSDMRGGRHGNYDFYGTAALPPEDREHRDLATSRLPVASSIYSRDENGDYVPVRHKWHKSLLSTTDQQQQLRRELPALIDSGVRLSASLSATHQGGQPLVADAVLHPNISSASTLSQTHQACGHRPPAVPSAHVAARKNYIDLGDMPAYHAARSQYLRQHPELASRTSHAPDRVSSPKDRIRQWAQAVRSGRPPSTITARSINTIDTTGSRPLSKFFANLRETGKPVRLGRSKQGQLDFP